MRPRRLRIVLADDTWELRALLRVTLELDGRFEVVAEAGDGAEAVAAVAATRPDAIVLDLAMPVMDGLEAISAIRRHAPETKVLVFSGFDATSVAQQALELGADAFVEKGTRSSAVAALLAELCGAGAVTRISHAPAARIEMLTR
jgi:DNA-binding NarL/FixJ family response regulator